MRILLQHLIPLVLPTLAYLGWLSYARWRARTTGGKAPELREGPWMWLVGGGLVLVIVSLVAFAVFGERFESGKLVSPRFIDGKVVPAQRLDE